MKSIMHDSKECYLCRKYFDICNDRGLHKHHVYEGWGNRSRSEETGCWIWLCGMHHNLSDYGIHFNKDVDLEVKQECQRKFEETHSREEFMDTFGRNYL